MNSDTAKKLLDELLADGGRTTALGVALLAYGIDGSEEPGAAAAWLRDFADALAPENEVERAKKRIAEIRAKKSRTCDDEIELDSLQIRTLAEPFARSRVARTLLNFVGAEIIDDGVGGDRPIVVLPGSADRVQTRDAARGRPALVKPLFGPADVAKWIPAELLPKANQMLIPTPGFKVILFGDVNNETTGEVVGTRRLGEAPLDSLSILIGANGSTLCNAQEIRVPVSTAGKLAGAWLVDAAEHSIYQHVEGERNVAAGDEVTFPPRSFIFDAAPDQIVLKGKGL
jgi:hypothetical protein